MDKRHNLSGIYFRQKNLTTNKYENVCFEELREEEQDRVLDASEPQFIKNLAKKLSQSLLNLGQIVGVYRE